MRVLFWNTHKNQTINDIVCELIIDNDISLVVLAEYSANLEELLFLLLKEGVPMKQYPTVGCDRMTIVGRKIPLSAGRQTEYASFQILNNEAIICCVHLPSRIYNASNGIRGVVIDRIMTDIDLTEIELQKENTIVVGDFNANPYDCECLDARYFHGIPFFSVAKNQKRIIAGKSFKMFYNPMWNFFGDAKKPYGTYYYSGNETSNTFWNVYDQVILRPSLKDRFIDSSLRIVTETGNHSLLNNRGHPDKNISDHLPLIFELMEEQHG